MGNTEQFVKTVLGAGGRFTETITASSQPGQKLLRLTLVLPGQLPCGAECHLDDVAVYSDPTLLDRTRHHLMKRLLPFLPKTDL